MAERINRTKVKEAAQGNIELARTKTGKPKKLSADKKKKLIENLQKIKAHASELSEQLSDIDDTIHN